MDIKLEKQYKDVSKLARKAALDFLRSSAAWRKEWKEDWVVWASIPLRKIPVDGLSKPEEKI